MSEPLNIIQLSGFDADGEPEIRLMADGSLYLVFNFMPPSWAEAAPEPFDTFDQKLQKATGVPVVWEDREFFLIPELAPDTVDRIAAFLQRFKNEQGPVA